MDFRTSWKNASHEHNDLPNGKLHNGTGVAVRCIKDHYPFLFAVIEVYLCGSNTECTNYHQFIGGIEYFLGYLGF